jgi:hypothetical protein
MKKINQHVIRQIDTNNVIDYSFHHKTLFTNYYTNMQSGGPSTIRVAPDQKDTWIPEGYILFIGPDDEKYIAPEFMLPTLDQDYHSNQKKTQLGALSAPGTVSFIAFQSESNWHEQATGAGYPSCFRHFQHSF